MPALPVTVTGLPGGRRGAGQPLLLIQAMAGHSLHWGEPFLQALERDFELVLYDHRGRGRSGPSDGPCASADQSGRAHA